MALIHLGRICSVLTIVLMLILSTCLIQSSRAFSEWNQTSYEDFYYGSFNNLTLTDKGIESDMSLSFIPAIWTDKKPAQPPNSVPFVSMATIWGIEDVLLYNVDNGTWTYNSTTNKWIKKSPSTDPGDLISFGLASIHGTDKVVLFGGRYQSNNTYSNKTWVYDLSDDEWTYIKTTNYPSARFAFSMATVWGTDNVVLCSGYGLGGPVQDTWVFDHSDKNWYKKLPSTQPPGSYYSAMASIWGTDKVLLFGGYSIGQYQNTTWIYDLGDEEWTDKKPSSSPPGRYVHAMAPVYGHNKVTLFGGLSTGSYSDDLWVYDLTINQWKAMGTVNKPVARYGHSMASSWGIDNTVLFGGYAWAGIQTDTWTLTLNLDMRYKNGTYTSPGYNAEYGAVFKEISWGSECPANTSVKFQIRTADKESKLDLEDFVGPDGNISTYYELSPSTIWEGHYNYKWFQYRAYFSTKDHYHTPSLDNVTLVYNLLPETTLSKPDDGTIISNNLPKFIWDFTDHDSSAQSGFQVVIDNERTFSDIDLDSGEQDSSGLSWQFPAGTTYTTIPDGTWYWKVRTKDNDGDWGPYSETRTVIIDTQIPDSRMIQPVDNGYYKRLKEFSGEASDPPSGSGLKKIELSLKRLSDKATWDGGKWVTNETWFTATGLTSWSYDSGKIGLESNQRYTLQSRAVDNASNAETPAGGTTFMIDDILPISKIVTPGDMVYLNELESIKGTASDISGSGLKSVEVMIQRQEDELYWTGTGWKVYQFWHQADLNVNWSFDTSSIPWTTDMSYKIESRATDLTENVEFLLPSATFMFDDKPPELSVSIKDKTEFVNEPEVELSIEATDSGSGVYQMALSQDGTKWSDWMAYKKEIKYVFKAGDGLKNISVRVKDIAGNIAEPVTDSTILDTTPPGPLSIIINDYARFTNNVNVQLILKAGDTLSGIDKMSFGYDELTWTDWEAYKIEKEFPLENKDGERTLLFRVRDKAGNIGVAFDNIILDTEPAYLQVIYINRKAEKTDTEEVTLAFQAEDSLSGVHQMSFSSDGQTWSDWEAYKEEDSRPYTLPSGDGQKTVYFRVQDRAGNIARPVHDTIMLVTEVPEEPEEDQEESTAVLTEVESNQFMFIFIIIVIAISVVLGSIFFYFRRRKRIEAEREAVSKSTRKAVVSKPSSVGLPQATRTPQLPAAAGATTTPVIPQLPPAQPEAVAAAGAGQDGQQVTGQMPEQQAPGWTAIFSDKPIVDEKKEEFPCSMCGEQLTKVSEGRFYCYTCQKYE